MQAFTDQVRPAMWRRRQSHCKGQYKGVLSHIAHLATGKRDVCFTSESTHSVRSGMSAKCQKRTSGAAVFRRLDPPNQHENDHNDQDSADEPDATVT
jgi:hypothetical protein